MSNDISKSCADFLRSYIESGDPSQKLKASHARELVAAFFGYKTHAALKLDSEYSLAGLSRVQILIPDVSLLRSRAKNLVDLPEKYLDPKFAANAILEHLDIEELFLGDVWFCESIEEYVLEKEVPKQQAVIEDRLAGVMAETNAYFDELYIDEAEVSKTKPELIVTASGQLNGENHPDKPFSGNQLDVQVTFRLDRVSSNVGYYAYDIEVGGKVNDDWVDPKYR